MHLVVVKSEFVITIVMTKSLIFPHYQKIPMQWWSKKHPWLLLVSTKNIPKMVFSGQYKTNESRIGIMQIYLNKGYWCILSNKYIFSFSTLKVKLRFQKSFIQVLKSVSLSDNNLVLKMHYSTRYINYICTLTRWLFS